ncbi:MAG: hypothetical protein ACRCR9_02935 [Chitinophagaceae bacterium]
MKKPIYFLSLLIIIANISSCLKYKELSGIKGWEMDVQGAAPLFSYALTIQDLFFKIAGYDETELHVDPNNRIYYWTQDIAPVNAIRSSESTLSTIIPIDTFIGADSVSFYTSSNLGTDPSIIANGLIGPTKRFTFPTKTGSIKLKDATLDIIQLDNITGKLKLKIVNNYFFPVKIRISFPELSKMEDITEKLDKLESKEHDIDVDGSNWEGKINNIIGYKITVTILNEPAKYPLDIKDLNNLELANTKIEDTLLVSSYDAIFGDVGKNRYLFKDSIRQKITITNPFILDPSNNSTFSNLNLRIDYFNRTLGIAANAKIYNTFFKMKKGELLQVRFWNNLTNSYDNDTFILPSKIAPLPDANSSATVTSFLLDTSNTNFKELKLDLKNVDSFLYNINFYSPEGGLSQDKSSFIKQSDSLNSASGILYIPYVLSSKILIDTSKTSVLNIPEIFYKDIENIIKERNKKGELEEIEFSMTVENNTIFSILPQVYFMDNNQVIDSFSNGQQNISAAKLSISGIVRIPTKSTITKKLTPEQWQQFSKCNRLTSQLFLETSTEVPFPAITNDMYVKFYFNIENIRFKYFIK